MSELRSRLERLGERVSSTADAFERLERARRRRERNRRITAGAVALLVAIAGSVAAFTAFRTGDDEQTIGGGRDLPAASGPSSPTAPAVSEPSEPPSAWEALCVSARARTDIHNGRALHVTGRELSFDTSCLIAPAGEPISILFSNLDPRVDRNISVYRLTPHLRQCVVTGTAPSGKVENKLFAGEIVRGVDEIVYYVGPLERGEYYFQDDVHPFANGVLVVE